MQKKKKRNANGETREQTKAYYDKYHGTPEAKKQRATRNRDRKESGLAVGDPREVDHKNALSKGGKGGKGNVRVVSRKTNRSYKRDRNNRPI